MLKIDGSFLEGGGQIARTALALSSLLKKSFDIDKIRLGRPKPGLKPQHMHCIKALEELYNASAEGAEIASTELRFIPRELAKKNLVVDIGTAGSISLLLQSLILPCFFSGEKINLKIIGGTDVIWSPQFDYLKEVILPHFRAYADYDLILEKRGYYPKGGGVVLLKIKSKYNLDQILLAPYVNLVEQGKLLQIKGVSHASKNLEQAQVAERQTNSAKVLLQKTFDCPVNIHTEYVDTFSAGSGITLWAVFGENEINFNNPVILGSDSLGEKGKRAEVVGEEAAGKLIEEINSGAAVDSHLADNLIPLLGLIGGKIKVSKVTNHTKTNIYTTEQFLDVKFKIEGNLISVEK